MTHCRPPLVAEVRHRPAGDLRLLRGENFQRIAVVGSVYLGHLGIRHATKDASTKASAGMPPAIAGLMRPPVLCLGRSSRGLRFASQSQKSCRTTPPAWSARRNTCQSRSASLDIRYLPCLLIWHSKSLLRRSCHRRSRPNRETLRPAAAHCPRPAGTCAVVARSGGCRPRCEPGDSTRGTRAKSIALGHWHVPRVHSAPLQARYE
jgi:hypothetical protein